MKIMFVEAKSNVEIQSDRAIVALRNFQKVGLVSTVQFLDQLPALIKILERAGKQVFIAKPRLHAVKDGQVLGCDVSAAVDLDKKVECILYVGTGWFHPLGAGYQIGKPIFTLNPFTGDTEIVSEKQIKRWQLQQQARILKAKEARVYGILITTKPGQMYLEKGQELKSKIESQGKKAYIFIADTVNPNELQNFPKIEAWINTACPRMIDDQELYNRPIVNPYELGF
jgi:2-(3-amino-3-carboxypropyl)histidine synthase